MKILWMSNAPHVGTGYGNQTKLFTPRIKKAGYEIVIFSFYGREGAPAINEDGIMELPRLSHQYGVDVVGAHYKYTKADTLISLIDPFALEPGAMTGMNWAAWTPVDSVPVSWGNVAALQPSKWQIAMSQFGKEQFLRAGFRNVLYVPHGIDTKLFVPGDRAEARAKVGRFINCDLDGKFLVIDVAANKGMPSRKNFDGLLMAFAEFSRRHEDAILYIHTDPICAYGEDLTKSVAGYGLTGKVFFPDNYLYRIGMLIDLLLNDIYNAADVMLHPALGEGFGIPVVEAQAAGCPVIVGDATAMSELCFSGWKIPAIPVSVGVEGSHQFLPLHPKLVEALEEAYQKRNDAEMRLRARSGAVGYDVDAVFEGYMKPALETIEVGINGGRKAMVARQGEIKRIKPLSPSPSPTAERGEEKPAVSVIIPAYGCAETIQEAVRSALKQRRIYEKNVDIEIIVVNNGADEKVDRAMAEMPYPGIHIIRIVSTSYADAMNAGGTLARGRYIQVLEGDDTLEPEALRKLCQALDDHPDKGFAYGDVQYHGALNHRWQPASFRREDFFSHSASLYPVMFRRELFTSGQVKWWQAAAGPGCSDWDFNIQLAKCSEGLPLPGLLVLHYMYQPNGLNGRQKKYERELMAELRQRHPEVAAEVIP